MGPLIAEWVADTILDPDSFPPNPFFFPVSLLGLPVPCTPTRAFLAPTPPSIAR